MKNLNEDQKKLNLNVIAYDINKMWNSHSYINSLRIKIADKLPKDFIYDPQDLEHQVLFRLTTFDPREITDQIIDHIVGEQAILIKERLSKSKYDLSYLFRGLGGKYQDLNVDNRLKLCWDGDSLIAKNERCQYNVEFKIIDDQNIISLFSSDLHYIHQDRPRGETFGFFFKGDDMPWALETTEPSVIAKQYKRDALLANGIDPNKAVELTRFYTLPGAPTNSVSIMDGLVAKYYKDKGIEALYTTTMPMYSKTKSTTIARGLNKPLLVKDLRHKFLPVFVDGRKLYKHVTTIPEKEDNNEIIKTHLNFPTMLTVEVYRKLTETKLEPLPVLQDGSKVIYVLNRENKTIETEIKLPVKDTSSMINKVRDISNFVGTYYIRDVVYGAGENEKKIRLRIQDNFNFQSIEATKKYKVDIVQNIKKEIEETIYKGEVFDDAVHTITKQGDYKEENSYEKIRIKFVNKNNTEITFDIYPFGSWIEIEGHLEDIHATAKKLGFKESSYINDSADELYLKWIKDNKLPEQWDVRFGLSGNK